MKIWSYYLECESEDLISQLEKDYRVQIRDLYCFCLDKDRIGLEELYDIKFWNGVESLREMLFDGINNILDFDLMCKSDMNLYNPSPLLFYNNFDKFLEEVKELFMGSLKYIIENYEECEKNYNEILIELCKRAT